MSREDGGDYQHNRHRYRSSAYVQHLAEACAIIANDARWRTSNGAALFSEQQGDDVSAIKALASLYDGAMTTPPPPNPSPTLHTKEDANKSNNSNNIDDNNIISYGATTTNQQQHHDDENNEEIIFERAMHLYSRMFVRKGPWFDLADLYSRYYYNHPPMEKTTTKKESLLEHDDEMGTKGKSLLGGESFSGGTLNNSTADCDDNDSNDNHHREKYEQNVHDVEKIHQFFKPRRSLSALSASSSSGDKTKNNNINEDNPLSSHRTYLEHLFRDVYHLRSMGLLRSFHSEYECGLVSGHVDVTSGRGMLLSAEERRDVLVRCGGGKGGGGKNAVRRSMGASTATAGSSTMMGKSMHNNEILNHMQSQQSLLASFFVTTTKSGDDGIKRRKRASSFPSSNSSTLLPVTKHVDAVLLRKLAVRVATLSSGHLTPPRKSEVEQALRIVNVAQSAALQHSITKHNLKSGKFGGNVDDDDDDDDVICLGNYGSMCSAFRLREAPLQTLRRCMRLFLCAGAGPGAMRGDGTNGWMSVFGDEVGSSNEDSCRTYPSTMSPSSGWHNVVYPGLSSRFGLEFYELSRCYAPILSTTSLKSPLGPFSEYHEFQLWEIGAEMRSFIDRVHEALATEKQQSRLRNREKRETQASCGIGSDEENMTIHLLTFNGLTLLAEEGRRDFVESILAPCFNEAAHSPQHIDLNQAIYNLCPTIEVDILSLTQQTIEGVGDDDTSDGFVCDSERLIVSFAVICWRILELRVEYPSSMLKSLVYRPWLRHMSFDAILAYILWDCVPIFERRGHHIIAVSILQTILFGREILSNFGDHQLWLERLKSEPYVECLLPRRNRGKACERLLIDMTHVERRTKKITQPKIDKKAKRKRIDEDQSPIYSFCNALLRNVDSIPFCSLRNLARRAKAPLPQTNERLILFIRPKNDDWSPKTDCAVANSLKSKDGVDSAAGKRCAFVGWEMHDDDGNTMEAHRSLNVEELAMEEYHSGRLPQDSNEVKGGWVGWHDEGGHVRALFRILQHFLIDFRPSAVANLNEQATVILTPFQNSSHDLHVGHFQTASGLQVRGFYERHRAAIEDISTNLTNLDAVGMSKIVFNAVKKRWDNHTDDRSRLKDPRLIKDVTELKTLSMIASALGPVAVSRIFRTLCFDYRHWSGGLPDLFMVRVCDCDLPTGDNDSPFIKLTDWIGEGFLQRQIDEKNAMIRISMLSDRDDEFLGQPKSADAFPSQQQNSRSKNSSIAGIQLPEFPKMLEFVHGERRVRADCMFVEVKSANDRLSERQEDWLSVLESSAKARVCKFTNSAKGTTSVGGGQ